MTTVSSTLETKLSVEVHGDMGFENRSLLSVYGSAGPPALWGERTGLSSEAVDLDLRFKQLLAALSSKSAAHAAGTGASLPPPVLL